MNYWNEMKPSIAKIIFVCQSDPTPYWNLWTETRRQVRRMVGNIRRWSISNVFQAVWANTTFEGQLLAIKVIK